jgi:hypothetical protein
MAIAVAMRPPIPTIKLHLLAMRHEEGGGEACVREEGVAAAKGLIEGQKGEVLWSGVEFCRLRQCGIIEEI